MTHPPLLSAEIVLFNALAKPLHYLIPPGLENSAQVGARVLVPLGRRHVSGLVLSRGPLPGDLPSHVKLRPILSVPDPLPLVPPNLVALCRWVSQYYFHPLGDVFRTALPPGLGQPPRQLFRLTESGEKAPVSADPSGILALFGERGRLTAEEVRSLLPPPADPTGELKELEASGLLERVSETRSSQPSPRRLKRLRLISTPDALEMEKNEELRNFIAALEGAGGILPMRDLRSTMKNFDYHVSKLRKKGVLDIEETEVPRESSCAQTIADTPPVTLNSGQISAVETVSPFIARPVFQPFLLFGATGSGKTEIYLNLVAEALAPRPERPHPGPRDSPEQPDGSPLPKNVSNPRSPSGTAVFRNPPGCEQWMEVLQGRKRVVLGVRSAVFMPLVNLGLVIVGRRARFLLQTGRPPALSRPGRCRHEGTHGRRPGGSGIGNPHPSNPSTTPERTGTGC